MNNLFVSSKETFNLCNPRTVIYAPGVKVSFRKFHAGALFVDLKPLWHNA